MMPSPKTVNLIILSSVFFNSRRFASSAFLAASAPSALFADFVLSALFANSFFTASTLFACSVDGDDLFRTGGMLVEVRKLDCERLVVV